MFFPHFCLCQGKFRSLFSPMFKKFREIGFTNYFSSNSEWSSRTQFCRIMFGLSIVVFEAKTLLWRNFYLQIEKNFNLTKKIFIQQKLSNNRWHTTTLDIFEISQHVCWLKIFLSVKKKVSSGFTIVILGGYYILQLIYGTDKLKWVVLALICRSTF